MHHKFVRATSNSDLGTSVEDSPKSVDTLPLGEVCPVCPATVGAYIEALLRAKRRNATVVVQFTAEWCKRCHVLSKELSVYLTAILAAPHDHGAVHWLAIDVEKPLESGLLDLFPSYK